MAITYKKLFLIDGIGAVISAFLLSQVLAKFVSVFGMPREVLFVLAGVAGCFAVYSLSCHLLIKENWKPYLRGIAVANTIYCVVTLGLVFYLHESLTWLGIAYFIVEILLVMMLVIIEIRKSTENLKKVPAE